MHEAAPEEETEGDTDTAAPPSAGAPPPVATGGRGPLPQVPPPPPPPRAPPSGGSPPGGPGGTGPFLDAARQRLGLRDDEPVRRNDNLTRSHHEYGGSTHLQALSDPRVNAHIFAPGIDLDEVERRVWERGVRSDGIRGHVRVTLGFDGLLGVRIQQGHPGVPCTVAEIKAARDAGGSWSYHLVPRVSSARSK